mgnify:CR=1 FL=1
MTNLPAPRTAGVALIAAGVLVAAISVLGDVLGVGATRGYYGHYQFIGTVAGLALLVLGAALWLSTVGEHGDED